ncbi:PorV/PorQ family protein [candidate division KSB1 bacterium]|nr:PorV/PorQ family protein [candidate division KSB1 bacterium]
MLKKISLVIILLTVITHLDAQTRKKTGQAGMTFLKIDGNARSSGMGGSFVSMGGDVISIFFNPAGLGAINSVQITLSQTEWLADIKHNAVGLAIPLGGYGVLGVSAINMDYGTLYGTTVSFASTQSVGFEYTDTGSFEVSDYALGIAYATHVTDRFSIGGQIRYVYEDMGENMIDIGETAKMSNNTISNYSMDFGTLYQTGFNDLTLGMSVRHFSGESTFPNLNEGFYMPLVYSVGIAMDLIQAFLPDQNQNHRFTTLIEGQHPNDSLERLHVGFEYALREFFFLRGGYKFNYDIESLSAGLGVRFNAGLMSMKFDYSISQMDYFDNVQRISLAMSL